MSKIVGFQSGHDVSYCILENGLPVLVEEWERISRKKMELGDGLKFFFSRAQQTSDIKYFTFGNWGGRQGKRQKICGDLASTDKMNQILEQNGGQFFEFGHHLSHAANAFYSSNFDQSLIITIDGGGWENDSLRTGFTISEGKNNKINQIKIFPISEVNLGGLWHDLTKYVFGLSVGFPIGDQAGTIMAMSTLGQPLYIDLLPDYQLNIAKLKQLADSSESEKFNVASSLQQYSENLFRNIVSDYIKDHQNICFSGGVSLNCVMLGKVKHWFPQIKNIFCDPVPYDAGLALGSARYLWHHILGNPRIKAVANMSPYLGKKYSRTEIKKACLFFSDQIKVKSVTDQEVLEKISDQKIVATFGGGSETGRRALGNRSLLADPRNPKIKAQINDKIKHRQWFRPLSPSILEERVGEWFEESVFSPYMSFAIKFKEDKRQKVPAVVHHDGTGRLQTVSKQLAPWFHRFLTQWEALSGVPILINTSFNDNEPIVETPKDAFKCFLSTGIDYLYFYDYGILVEKLCNLEH